MKSINFKSTVISLESLPYELPVIKTSCQEEGLAVVEHRTMFVTEEFETHQKLSNRYELDVILISATIDAGCDKLQPTVMSRLHSGKPHNTDRISLRGNRNNRATCNCDVISPRIAFQLSTQESFNQICHHSTMCNTDNYSVLAAVKCSMITSCVVSEVVKSKIELQTVNLRGP